MNFLILDIPKLQMIYSRFLKVPLAVLIITCLTACISHTEIESPYVNRVNSTLYSYIAWSPDGSTILAIGRRYPPTSVAHLYLIDIETGKSEKITETPLMFDYPSWSPDGSMAALTVDLSSIWLLDIYTHRISELAEGEGAVWLPNGNELAVYFASISNRGTDHREIRVLDLHGTILRTIDIGMVSNTQREQSPIAAEYLSGIGVSPNGDQLIINLEIYPDNGDKTWESFLVNIEKGTTEPILDDEQATGVSWSPDVKRIAFIREVLHLDGYLVTQNLETDCETVAPFPPKIHSPSWSDDPANLVFLYEGLIHIWEIGVSFQEGVLEGCP